MTKKKDTTDNPITVQSLFDHFVDEKIRRYKQSKGIVTDDQKRIWVIYARRFTSGKKKNKDGEEVERQEKSVEDQLKLCHQYAEDNGISILT